MRIVNLLSKYFVEEIQYTTLYVIYIAYINLPNLLLSTYCKIISKIQAHSAVNKLVRVYEIISQYVL